MFKFFKKIDWFLIGPAIFLTFLGLLEIYSISGVRGDFLDFKKQIIFFALAIFLVIFLNFFDLRFLKTNSYLVLSLYFFSILTLLGLFLFGSEVRGVRGWYKIGPFSFDPVPFSAIILIIVLSKYFSTRHIEQRFSPILFSGIYCLLPALLILFQPDLGSSLILVFVWFGLVIFSGIKIRHFLILLFLFSLIFLLGWNFWLKDYQKQRILSFFNPQIDKRGVGWSVNQSKIAIGSGGFWGKGIGQGSQTQYGFLPEPKTDFIFSAIAEELGFFGVSLVLLALFILFWKIVQIAFLAVNNFTRLVATGLAFLILTQSFVNIGMALGLFPVIGIPLPFVSYGGSQLLAFYFGLGILQSLRKAMLISE